MNNTSHFGERKLFISIASRFLLVADERKKKFIRRAGAAVGGRPNRQILPLFLKRSQKFFGGRQSLPGLMSLLEHTFFVPGNKLLMQLVFCYMLLRFSHHFLPLKISSKLGPEVLVFLNRLRAANYFKKGVRALLLKNRHAIIKSRESRKRGLYHLRRLSNRLNKLHLRKPKFGYFALKKYYKKLSNLGEQLALVRSRLVNSG